MSGTINSVTSTTVNLDSSYYNDNVTISSLGTVDVSSGFGISAANAVTIVNSGLVNSGDNEGVYLGESGSVTNFGTISGQDGGVYTGLGTLALVNYGTIIGGDGNNPAQGYFKSAGIDLYAGTIDNEGVISGYQNGVYAWDGTSVLDSDAQLNAYIVNNGTITATAALGVGVRFANGGTLINSGTIFGGTDAVYFARYLADDNQVIDARIIVDPGAVFGGMVVAQADAHNVIELASGASAGVLDMGSSFTGFSTIQIDAGAAWTLEGDVAALGTNVTISGLTNSDTLVLSGFAGAETIDLAGITATSDSFSGGVLTLYDAGGAAVAALTLAEPASISSASFTLATGTAGTDITLCFYAGTRIATPSGEVAVENLRAGDLVETANGPRPVRWLGRSDISTRFVDKMRTLPICITAGALGDGLPAHDLLVSADHALYLDGILVHASALIDGVTVLRAYDVPEQFSYYHVELETHELLLAEGVWAESFVDNADRMHFSNWAERETPATPIVEMPYPRAKSARQLPARLRVKVA